MPTMNRTRARDAEGSTLIEMIFVVLVLGVILGSVATSVVKGRDTTVENQAEASIRTVMLAQTSHASSYGSYTPNPIRLDLPEGPDTVPGAPLTAGKVGIAVGADGSAGFATVTDHEVCLLGRLDSPYRDAAPEVWSEPTSACDAAAALPAGVAAVTEAP